MTESAIPDCAWIGFLGSCLISAHFCFSATNLKTDVNLLLTHQKEASSIYVMLNRNLTLPNSLHVLGICLPVLLLQQDKCGLIRLQHIKRMPIYIWSCTLLVVTGFSGFSHCLFYSGCSRRDLSNVFRQSRFYV
uniref:CDK5RAP3 n=1 Tax=Mesocestoides corti TaxID=53468 RepID=A0A5K3EF10_MESCO